MLRKRSRTVASNKQTLVSDHSSSSNISSSSSEKSYRPTSFLFNSPRIFKDFFLSKDISPEQSKATIMSPSSVLDTKHLFSTVFSPPPQWLDPQNLPSPKRSWEHTGIGLALIEHDDELVLKNKPSKEKTSKMVVFGSQLKIQIPTPPPQTPISSPQSPMEFGIKTPKSSLLGQVFVNTSQPEQRSLSMEDIELSEDYTCVISHGPNPKTTHIFGNCIVEYAESRCTNGVSTGFRGRAETSFSSPRSRDTSAHVQSGFLSFCNHCNKKIGQGKDIYMYRGESAFCSQECRSQEMLLDGIES